MTRVTVSFRPATKADLPDIVSLVADDKLGQLREDSSIPLNRNYFEAFDAIDREPDKLLAVAEIDGAPVGCAQVTFVPGLSRLGMWRGQIESV